MKSEFYFRFKRGKIKHTVSREAEGIFVNADLGMNGELIGVEILLQPGLTVKGPNYKPLTLSDLLLGLGSRKPKPKTHEWTKKR